MTALFDQGMVTTMSEAPDPTRLVAGNHPPHTALHPVRLCAALPQVSCEKDNDSLSHSFQIHTTLEHQKIKIHNKTPYSMYTVQQAFLACKFDHKPAL